MRYLLFYSMGCFMSVSIKELKQGAFFEYDKIQNYIYYEKINKIIMKNKDSAVILLDTNYGKRLARCEKNGSLWRIFLMACYDCSNYTKDDLKEFMF